MKRQYWFLAICTPSHMTFRFSITCNSDMQYGEIVKRARDVAESMIKNMEEAVKLNDMCHLCTSDILSEHNFDKEEWA